MLIGVLATASGVWASVRTDHNTEERLLQVQTRQAATVLATAIGNLQQPLSAALDVQAAVPRTPRAERAAFSDQFARNVGDDELFLSAALWRRTSDGGFVRVASLGLPPGLQPGSTRSDDFLARATKATTAAVQRVDVGQQTRFAYGLADDDTGLVVYAERAIPADRRAPVDRDSAFSGLDYAIYLGSSTDLDDMTTTDVDPSDLPLTGLTYETSVPFGDNMLTLVTRPREHLGSELGQQMPWLVLVGGLTVTFAALAVARQVLRARERAESDTRTISALYRKVETLYGEQRDLSVRLQRALLPQTIPTVPGIEIAAEYVAAATGIDIGGDWYSVVEFDEGRFAFVVGDVSGHGIDAVAEMARARFTLRAYLVDGDAPDRALSKCAPQFDIAADGHLVTVIAGVGDWRTGEVTMASAGHLVPLLIDPEGATEFVPLPVGPPLGTGPSSYEAATVVLQPGWTLVCYTDGLVERRTEDIDAGLDRLARVAAGIHSGQTNPLRSFVAALLDGMRDDARSDDIAVLALKRADA
ncbi:hypothetical protein GCM10022242_20880 [Nocardioides panacisoli]|uniref:PPM-type phosphatase domain-containing protein n=1 Tax=Nocardioides panacisoli TaxID=627624 RepID=A0ABP7IHX3_9ACTN